MYILAGVGFLVISAFIFSFIANWFKFSTGNQFVLGSYTTDLSPLGTQQEVAGASSSIGVASLETKDWRAYVLDEYFRVNNSPLVGTGQIFIDACNESGAPKDCTTAAAIARAETNLCKYYNSASYYNCWGFGGGGPHRRYFTNWVDSIHLVTGVLAHQYGEKYMINPSLMERTFCGWEAGCTNWGNRVKFFMREISDFSKELGFEKTLFELR